MTDIVITKLMYIMYDMHYYCYYCERKFHNRGGLSSSVDHIIPRSKGGNNAMVNKVVCCKDCNILKGSMMPIQLVNEMLTHKGGDKTSITKRVTNIPKKHHSTIIDNLIEINKRVELLRDEMSTKNAVVYDDIFIIKHGKIKEHRQQPEGDLNFSNIGTDKKQAYLIALNRTVKENPTLWDLVSKCKPVTR